MVVNMKTYGTIEMGTDGDFIILDKIRPHVSIRLKALFPKIAKTSVPPYVLRNTPETCADIMWFIKRYPLEMINTAYEHLEHGDERHKLSVQKAEEIHLPNYKPRNIELKAEKARDYQLRAADMHYIVKRMLLGDDVGLGKTLSGILTFLNPGTLPGLVVVQTHLARQWKAEIERFTHLRAYIIQGTKPFDLPEADVYIMKYSCLAGWVNMFDSGFFRSVVFDEVQELRRSDSLKYKAANVLATNVEHAMGMSATPIYNYGDEIFNVLNLLKPGCLGDSSEFYREWVKSFSGGHAIISDPDALGSYLRDNHLMLRRTRADVGRELPPVNKIIQLVDYDHGETQKADNLARQLAQRVLSGSFIERGAAARELDLLVRLKTGVSKAREVAEYVKIILSNGEPVLLAGWHREVYTIWADVLKEFNPVFYTGTESESQKEKSKKAFVNGETNLFIISLRSGIGLDGLQHRCRTVVIGELDWSPKVHEQLIGRLDRDMQKEQVTAIFTVSDYGSDPVIMDVLGLKASQSHAIMDPLTQPAQTFSDDSRIKILAQTFLNKQ